MGLAYGRGLLLMNHPFVWASVALYSFVSLVSRTPKGCRVQRLSLAATALVQLSSAMVVVATTTDVVAVADLSAVDPMLTRDDLPLPPQGWVLHCASSKCNVCASGTSWCVLVGSQETLHSCMGGNGPGPHRRGKCWRKPLLFLRLQVRTSAEPFDTSWFLGSEPRELCKKAQQRSTSAAMVS